MKADDAKRLGGGSERAIMAAGQRLGGATAVRTRQFARLSLVVLMAVSTPAASARTNAIDKPIYFIHGISVTSGSDCNMWNTMIARFRELANALPPIGPKIPFAARTVAYYHRDKNCNTKIYENGDHSKHYGGAFNAWHRKGGGHTVDVRIEHLGYHLAWDIYNRYSKNEQPVDVVAHSMGGLIIRYALMATKLGVKDFPPFLLVEDVVTMGTPHGGSKVPGGLIPVTTSTQDQEMLVDSPFLRRMERLPEGYMPAGRDGTDWLTMGSGYDKFVSATSAAGVGPGANGKPVARFIGSQHKVMYYASNKIGHSDYYKSDAKGGISHAIYSFGMGPFISAHNVRRPVYLAFASVLSDAR